MSINQMRFLQFNIPPLPYCVICGEDYYTGEDLHPDRDNLEEFDLLVVTRGKLPMFEEENSWEVGAGQALILQPHHRHFQLQPCPEPTHFFWLHFQISGNWSETIVENQPSSPKTKKVLKFTSETTEVSEGTLRLFTTTNRFTYKYDPSPFSIKLAQFSTLLNPEKTYADFRILLKLQEQPQAAARWKQQIIFQNVLEDLSEAHNQLVDNSLTELAERVALFLRQNYTQPINYKLLRQELNFHPVYLARCMQRIYGCSPIEYLNQYRLEQAKLLLINTDTTITKIAEAVGFRHISYFTRSFSKREGINPQMFRKQFRSKNTRSQRKLR